MSSHDDFISTVEEYRHHARHTFTPAPLASVIETARLRRRRRLSAGVAAAALSAAGMIWGVSAFAQRTDHAPVSGVTPQPTRSALGPGARKWQEGQADDLDYDDWKRLVSLTIVLPQWPGKPECPSGELHFRVGVADRGGLRMPGFSERTFRAWVDGSQFATWVVPVTCGSERALLTLKQVDGELRSTGYLPGVLNVDRFYPSLEGGLGVEERSPSGDQEQRRTYRWLNGQWRQTFGETSFSAPRDVREVDLANGSFRWGEVTLSFVDGQSSAWGQYLDYQLLQVDTGLLAEPGADGAVGDAVVVISREGGIGGPETWVLDVSGTRGMPILKVGEDGVLGVVSARIINGQAEIVVNTAAGEQTRHYRSTRAGFERVD